LAYRYNPPTPADPFEFNPFTPPRDVAPPPVLPPVPAPNPVEAPVAAPAPSVADLLARRNQMANSSLVARQALLRHPSAGGLNPAMLAALRARFGWGVGSASAASGGPQVNLQQLMAMRAYLQNSPFMQMVHRINAPAAPASVATGVWNPAASNANATPYDPSTVPGVNQFGYPVASATAPPPMPASAHGQAVWNGYAWVDPIGGGVYT
jgi:hypothetical protein